MNIIETTIPDVKIISPNVFSDKRGFFFETYKDDWFKSMVDNLSFVQDNHSESSLGTLRGLHYQIKQPQGKLVRVIKGIVYDVAVDLRQSSPFFGKYVGEYLSEDNKRQLWVPPGFAHGFYVLTDKAEFVYKCTDYYAPEFERCLIWNDATIGIDWPLLSSKPPIISSKDALGDRFKDLECFL